MPLLIPKPSYCSPGFNMTPALEPSCASSRCRISASGCCWGAPCCTPCCPCCCRYRQSHAWMCSCGSVHANLLGMWGLQTARKAPKLTCLKTTKTTCQKSLQLFWKMLEWIALLDITENYSATRQQHCSELAHCPQYLEVSHFAPQQCT